MTMSAVPHVHKAAKPPVFRNEKDDRLVLYCRQDRSRVGIHARPPARRHSAPTPVAGRGRPGGAARRSNLATSISAKSLLTVAAGVRVASRREAAHESFLQTPRLQVKPNVASTQARSRDGDAPTTPRAEARTPDSPYLPHESRLVLDARNPVD